MQFRNRNRSRKLPVGDGHEYFFVLDEDGIYQIKWLTIIDHYVVFASLRSIAGCRIECTVFFFRLSLNQAAIWIRKKQLEKQATSSVDSQVILSSLAMRYVRASFRDKISLAFVVSISKNL